MVFSMSSSRLTTSSKLGRLSGSVCQQSDTSCRSAWKGEEGMGYVQGAAGKVGRLASDGERAGAATHRGSPRNGQLTTLLHPSSCTWLLSGTCTPLTPYCQPALPDPPSPPTCVRGGRLLRGGKPGRAPSMAAWRAASTGSWPWKGTVVSNSWKMIMAKLYTSTLRL